MGEEIQSMNIYKKLIEVRKSVSYLKKEAEGKQFKYNPSSQVLMSVKEKLDEMNLLLIPAITDKRLHHSSIDYYEKDTDKIIKRTITYFTELDMTMAWVNGDNPEERIEVPWYAQGVDIAGEKGVGKALTYAEKYFILKQFNIATDKDDPDSLQKEVEKNNHSGEEPPNKISEKQISRLFAIAKKHQISNQAVKNVVMDRYKKDQVADLTKSEYDEVITLMESREQS